MSRQSSHPSIMSVESLYYLLFGRRIKNEELTPQPTAKNDTTESREADHEEHGLVKPSSKPRRKRCRCLTFVVSLFGRYQSSRSSPTPSPTASPCPDDTATVSPTSSSSSSSSSSSPIDETQTSQATVPSIAKQESCASNGGTAQAIKIEEYSGERVQEADSDDEVEQAARKDDESKGKEAAVGANSGATIGVPAEISAAKVSAIEAVASPISSPAMEETPLPSSTTTTIPHTILGEGPVTEFQGVPSNAIIASIKPMPARSSKKNSSAGVPYIHNRSFVVRGNHTSVIQTSVFKASDHSTLDINTTVSNDRDIYRTTFATRQELFVRQDWAQLLMRPNEEHSIFHKYSDNSRLEVSTTIDHVRDINSKLSPRKVMLHEEVSSMLIMKPQEEHSIFRMDLERGRIAEEWQADDSISVDSILPYSNFAQLAPEKTVIGTNHKSILRVDLPLAASQRGSETRPFVKTNDFSRGGIVKEWKVDDGKPVKSIFPDSKFVQLPPQKTIIEIQNRALFGANPRLSEDERVDTESRQHFTNNEISNTLTISKGEYNKSDIRLVNEVRSTPRTQMLGYNHQKGGIDRVPYGRAVVRKWSEAVSADAAMMKPTNDAKWNPPKTFVGSNRSSLHKVNPLRAGNKREETDPKQYVTKCAMTTTLNRLGSRARTQASVYDHPIIGIDATADGKSIVGAQKKYCSLPLVVSESHQSGFRNLECEKATSEMVIVNPEHAGCMGVEVALSPARFNTGEDKQERTIVTSSGPYAIIGEVDPLLHGFMNDSRIKHYGDPVISDEVTNGYKESIIVTLPERLKMIYSIKKDLDCYPWAGTMGPVQIFGENASEERAENARLSSFVGAIAVGDLVKSTLGPKGMDKILASMSRGEIMVTNDGATILKSIALDNAAAKVLVNISKVQDDEVGDGTTSVCVLAAELLREGEKLVAQKIHPQTIIEGYRIASAAAFKALEAAAVDNRQVFDLGRLKDPEHFRKDLINIAKTTLSSKVLSQDKEYFAKLAVDAVLRLKGSTNLDNIQIIKKPGGKLIDSYLAEGFILDKKIGVNQPKRIENAKILVANTPMDYDKIKIFGARVKVDATGKLAELERAEREKMKAKVEKIKAHGINCFVNRQLIYNWPEQLFADAGIMSIEHADFDGIERLALVTGGEITSTFDHPDLVKLGRCDLIEEIIIGEDRLIKFSGVAAGEACTVVLRGATTQLLDEAERSLHDALCVLSQTVQEPRTVLGGGCAEMLMAKVVDELAVKTPGKRAIAVESFARALRQLPTILADNAGYDSSDLVAQLRASHAEGNTTAGLNMYEGIIGDMSEAGLGITESFKLKRQVLLSASEAAEMILRVDDIIRCAPRQRNRE
ncbi:hypothetical protein SmJEL517_g04731 [Synchytrium microbalum]|uniref:CCT-beta n=1 Tax=Synchytrium microbalum TaxID=1806994 RepID=A0A507C292_9FUNG|nr:uncharacterized protein SmJEL517_g04731 [Synchytrium microbalum]TPX32076.1 hypothetical protein SmJEL517_g04731 [Synchytrium microbalum]